MSLTKAQQEMLELAQGSSSELSNLDTDIIETIEALNEYYTYHKIDLYYPDEDIEFMGQKFPARHRYERYLQFFAAGADFLERAAFCGNQIGKSESLCGYETALHATGRYPHWWQGKRFKKPLTMLCAGKSSATTRDLVQFKLFGDADTGAADQKAVDKYGTGLIPKEDILKVKFQAGGAPGAIDTAYIRNRANPKIPTKILFRSYEQGRKAAEGLVLDWIWVDEEPGLDFYNEAKRGLLNTDGNLVCSFTPLEGVTETVLRILGEDAKLPIYNPELYRHEIKEMLKEAT